MLQIVRTLFLAGILGILIGLLMALDPLLPIMNITAPEWVWMILGPSVLIFRFLILFGPIALLSGGIASYRVARGSDRNRRGIFVSGLIGLSLLIANIIFFTTLLILLSQNQGLQQTLETRTGQLLENIPFAATEADQGPLLSPAMVVFFGLAACSVGIFNLVAAVVSGVCGGWLALRQRQPRQ